MNAVVDSTVSTPRASQPIGWAQRMRWLLRRIGDARWSDLAADAEVRHAFLGG